MFVIRPLPSSSIRGVQQSGRRPAAGSPDRRVGVAGPLRADADSSRGGPQLRCRQVGCRDRQGTRPFREHCGVLRPRGRPEARRASAGRARVAIGVAPRVHSPSFCVSGRESPTASFRARRSEPRIPFSRVALTPAAEAGLTALDDIARRPGRLAGGRGQGRQTRRRRTRRSGTGSGAGCERRRRPARRRRGAVRLPASAASIAAARTRRRRRWSRTRCAASRASTPPSRASPDCASGSACRRATRASSTAACRSVNGTRNHTGGGGGGGGMARREGDGTEAHRGWWVSRSGER